MSISYLQKQKSVLSLFGYSGDSQSKGTASARNEDVMQLGNLRLTDELIRSAGAPRRLHDNYAREYVGPGEAELGLDESEDLEESFEGVTRPKATRSGDDIPQLRSSSEIKMSPVYPANIGILPKHQHFSVFKKKHAEEAATVYNYLISRETYEEFEAASTYFQGILNMGLYIYALTVALAHREDGSPEVDFPPIYEVCPSSFIPNSKIRDALAQAAQANESTSTDDQTDGKTKSAVKFQTGSVRDPEFKVAWWREDIGLNVHHNNWHKVYPHNGIARKYSGEPEETAPKVKDRQGELFYYMHHQMLARYDAERIAVGLMRVVPYSDWSKPITEGYNSQLTDYYGTNQFAPRPSGMVLSDLNYSDREKYSIAEHTYSYHRLLDAINTGTFQLKNGGKKKVDIDGVGSAVESSIGSPNDALYGDVHNMGHDLLGVITDPDGRYGKQMGVMGDPKTAVRDPIFFRWHKFADDLFELHKAKVPIYKKGELQFKGITVSSIDVQMTNMQQLEKNELKTFMGSVDVSVGKFLLQRDEIKKPEADVQVKVDQLNHEEFNYSISVNNKTGKKKEAVFRIFFAPTFDEHGNRYDLQDQRKLFIELDKFVKELAPGQNNDITRCSSDSSVVMPPSFSTNEIETKTKEHKESRDEKKDSCACRKNRYCKCGWPPNLLIPRGTESGMAFDLFVMVTNWSADRVPNNGADGNNLDQGTSYCGTKNKKYPDKRPMGFPFDRPIDDTFVPENKDGSTHIYNFTNQFSNMTAVPIKIVFDKSK